MTTSGIAEVREQDLRLPDGRSLHLYDSGDPRGELVLFHHGTPGAGMPAPWWAEDAKVRGIRLVGYDRPGYGGSDRSPGRCVADVAADVTAIADALGASRLRTWGGSGGGPHALACAALLPDRVIAAAVAASVAPYRAAGLDWSAGMGQDNVDEFAAAIAGEAALSSYLSEAHRQIKNTDADGLATTLRTLLPDVDVTALNPELSGYLHQGFRLGLSQGYDGWLDDDLAFAGDWGFDPATIAAPVLLLHGRHDLMVPFAHGEWLAAIIPGVSPRLTDSDGHLTLLHKVDEIHAWLLDQR